MRDNLGVTEQLIMWCRTRTAFLNFFWTFRLAITVGVADDARPRNACTLLLRPAHKLVPYCGNLGLESGDSERSGAAGQEQLVLRCVRRLPRLRRFNHAQDCQLGSSPAPATAVDNLLAFLRFCAA